MSLLCAKRPLDLCSSYMPPSKSRRTDVRLYQALDRIAPLPRSDFYNNPTFRVGPWVMNGGQRSQQFHSPQPPAPPPIAPSRLLPNATSDENEDVEMDDAPADVTKPLDSSDADAYSRLLRASTTDLCRDIQPGGEYSTITLRMKDFIKGVWRLARLPYGYEFACDTLVWFSISVLHRTDSPFVYMLNSQRQSIYFLLDDAMLYIALEWWEKSAIWDVWTVVKDIRLGLSAGKVEWWERGSYFAKSLEFLLESQRVFDVRTMVLLVAGHRLPPELTDQVSGYLLYHKGLPLTDVKTKHDWRSNVARASTTTAASSGTSKACMR
ncbi:hypothetical protein BU16DRAFT_168747 [Lophium mytilinum]|uniref:Uncharacterized protein n=1 Tax=Lophium mytilinum TaxID=390894 RepID=A0A6A6QDD2_9PEZI|nr:hypothetical protein BU16DRAFT_168747 [Lophium mytilinum]